ncbi:hypothetical protein Pam2_40 [Pseudanabaena phage Pam2]|nr:hypothetical protein Pam2_40 [Pseudanabaena phage Pam2]
MTQDINYNQALADIKAGLQNVIPRVSQSGNKVTMVQGTETYTFNIAQPVTSTNILK